MLNYAPCNEDLLETGGITPRILNIATRWGECWVTCYGRFNLGQRSPVTIV